MQELARFFSNGFNFNFLNINLSGSSLRAFAIVGLIFLLVLTLAQVRRHYVNWSIKGAVFGIFFGFLLALILEGFLIVGGKTAVTEFLGWKNAPQPLQTAIDVGRAKLVDVLGIANEIPKSVAQENPTSDDAVTLLQSLPPGEMKKVKSLICEP